MLLLKIYILVLTIPLASTYLSTISTRIAFLILLFNALASGIDILGGLFQPTFLTSDTLILSFIPVIIYSDAKINKSQLLNENKGKAGIYLWTHKESGKKYIGSAVDLSRRLKDYYSTYTLNKINSYIYKALISHSHSAFSLSILEYIDIKNLSKIESKELILKREQYYLDSLLPEYNILQTAGNSLGYKHTEDSLEKMSIIKLAENNPMFNKKGKDNHMFGKKGVNHPIFGTLRTEESKLKISIANGTAIYVYTSDKSTLVNTFTSARKAGLYFNVDKKTIINYAKTGKLFKEQWFLSIKELIT